MPAASATPASLPGGALALGAFFSVFGVNIGPPDRQKAEAFPLPTELGGVRVEIRKGGQRVATFLVFAWIRQINGIIPSNAPTGDCELVVIRNGVESNPIPVRIVRHNFQIFAVFGGRGPGIITNFVAPGNEPLNTRSAPAIPGQTPAITIWGSGGGPVPFADNNPPVPGNLPCTTFPSGPGCQEYEFDVEIGGVPHTKQDLLYHGRAGCCSGLDQLNVRLNNAVRDGCYVPVKVRAGGPGAPWSNTVTMAISRDGQPCSDPQNPFSSLSQTGGVAGSIVLMRNSIFIPNRDPEEFVADVGFAGFGQQPPGGDLAFNPLLARPTLGSCQVYSQNEDITSLLSGIVPLVKTGANETELDAGNELTITIPGGQNVSVPRWKPDTNTGPYLALGLSTPVEGFSTGGTFLDQAGTYRVRAPGGTGVGPIDASIVRGPAVVWTNRNQISSIDRTQGVTVNWTGGSPNETVAIVGFGTDQDTTGSSAFFCFAAAADGTFTVPSSAVSNFPLTRGRSLDDTFVVLSVGTSPTDFPRFTATGVDGGIIFPLNLQMRTVEVTEGGGPGSTPGPGLMISTLNLNASAAPGNQGLVLSNPGFDFVAPQRNIIFQGAINNSARLDVKLTPPGLRLQDIPSNTTQNVCSFLVASSLLHFPGQDSGSLRVPIPVTLFQQDLAAPGQGNLFLTLIDADGNRSNTLDCSQEPNCSVTAQPLCPPGSPTREFIVP